MSENLGKIKSIKSVSIDVSDSIFVTQFWGGKINKSCLQLTISERYVQLDKKGIKKLRKLLKQAL